MKALWALHVWQQDGVAHTHRRTNNKQTTRQSEIPLTQQSEIPLTLAQIEDTRSQTQESKMDNLPTL